MSCYYLAINIASRLSVLAKQMSFLSLSDILLKIVGDEYNNCMDELINSVYKLKSILNSNEDILKLNELEKKISENNEVISLSYKKDQALDEYNQLLKIFKEDSKEIIESRKRLLDAKENLYNHPLVKEYLNIFSRVRNIYNEVNDILFSDFALNKCHMKRK